MINADQSPGIDCCRVCGAEVGFWRTVYDNELGLTYGVKPWCPEHCHDHDFEYSRYDREHLCTHCGKEREYEPMDDDVPISFIEPCRRLGTPISEISTRPGTRGYEEWLRICRSWGHE